MKKKDDKNKKKYIPGLYDPDITKEDVEKWNIEYFGSENYLPLDESEEDDDITPELDFEH